MNKLFYSLLFYCLSVSLSNERETDNSLLFEQANESSMLIIEDRLPIADPYVLFYEDKYYAYGTRTNGFEVYISDDLEHWRRGDRLALSPQDSWGTKWYWAPEVYYIESEKKFYMFYTVDEHICVATSDNPEGPFVQDEKKPIREEKSIDASLFMDDNGKAYLYFVRFTGGNVIWGVEMNSDLKSVKEETFRECIKADASWELQQAKVAEGPSLLKRNGVYYLIYSANHFRSQDYAVGYATATSPLGPWRKYVGNPILCRDKDVVGGLVGTGHGAPFLCRDGSYKYIYHAHSSVSRVEPRTSYLNDLIFGDDGVISIVGNVINPVVESFK